jgi:beta-mannosidase
MKQLLLTDGWHLRLGADDAPPDDEGWVPARVPGTAHLDLLAAGRIPDPFVGFNEHAVAWLGEQDVRYRCAFTLPPGWLAPGERLVLRCDGLDTFAAISLNGTPIGQNNNMFVPLEISIDIDGGLLRPGENELVMAFSCAAREARAREAAHGRMRVWNGDPSRVYVRKAQYHWGWDWGPTLLCAGPYRPVRLLRFRARLRGLRCPAEVAPDLASATLPVALEVDGEGAAAVALRLYDPAGSLCAEAEAPVEAGPEGGQARHTFSLPDPALWWPAGQGAQARYLLHAALLSPAREVLDEGRLHLGLRRVVLRQEPLVGEPGTSFHFEINNRPLFCGGANWIPADSFLPRVSGRRYRALLQMARDAGMVMIRVWGGGIYEEDVFYDLCDELGLLVWQDFMFACGLYPDEPWFQRSVEAEAREAVRRLRHHPSVVLWCGNNEDYVLAASVGAYGAGAAPGPNKDGEQGLRFAARPIYERLLAAVCAAEDPSRTYWPGSPFTASEADAQDPLVGDRHTWEVWHGNMADYQDYGRFAGRFVSEFGMQAYPDLATLASLTGAEGLLPGPEVLAFHNKADGGTDRLRTYLERNLPDLSPKGLDGMVYATQLMQAEALGWAFRSFRRRFGGPWRRAVSGALVWQLNDCWPCISWSVIDYALRPKASYHVIRRELLPRCVGLSRGAAGQVQAWCVNGTAEEASAVIALRAFTLDGEEVVDLRRDLPVRLGADRAVELGDVAPPPGPEVVVGARLLIGGAVVSRAALWPEPLRDARLRDPGLRVTSIDDKGGEDGGGRALRLSVARPAKGVLLRAAGDPGGGAWSDNLLDLLPGDEQVVRCAGAGPLSFEVRHLQEMASGSR